jgi:hypothetical protein
MRQKGISEKMVNCMKEKRSGNKFGVKRGKDKETDFVEEGRGVRQSGSPSPDIVDCISEGNLHAPVTGSNTTPRTGICR